MRKAGSFSLAGQPRPGQKSNRRQQECLPSGAQKDSGDWATTQDLSSGWARLPELTAREQGPGSVHDKANLVGEVHAGGIEVHGIGRGTQRSHLTGGVGVVS